MYYMFSFCMALLLSLQKAQQHVGSKKEYQSQLSEMIESKTPLKEVSMNDVKVIQKGITCEVRIFVQTFILALW